MLQKIFESALMKARNYKIQQKWMKLSFNIIYHHKISINLIKITYQSLAGKAFPV